MFHRELRGTFAPEYPRRLDAEIKKAQQVSPLGFRIQNLSILYCSNGSHPG